jgi:hypothetical protein
VNFGTLKSRFSASLYGKMGFRGRLLRKATNGEPVKQ